MCPKCDAFSERLTFRTPVEYVSFVRRLVVEASERRLSLVYGDCALEELTDSPPWPTGDLIVHELQCTVCGQFFHLSADVYHGRSGWEPQSPEEWASERAHYIQPD